MGDPKKQKFENTMYARKTSATKEKFAARQAAAKRNTAAVVAAGLPQGTVDYHDVLAALAGNSYFQKVVEKLHRDASRYESLKEEAEYLRTQGSELRKENGMLRKAAGKRERDQDEELRIQLYDTIERLEAQNAELRTKRPCSETMSPPADDRELRVELEQLREAHAVRARLLDDRMAELQEANQKFEKARAAAHNMGRELRRAMVYVEQLSAVLKANEIEIPEPEPIEPADSEEGADQSEGALAHLRSGAGWLADQAWNATAAATSAVAHRLVGAGGADDDGSKPNGTYVQLEGSGEWVYTASPQDRAAANSRGNSCEASPRALHAEATQMMVDGIAHLDLDCQGGGDVTEKADAPPPPAPPAPAGGNGTRKRAPPSGPPQISAAKRAELDRSGSGSAPPAARSGLMDVLGDELAVRAGKTSANHRANKDLRKPPGSQAATGPKADTVAAQAMAKMAARAGKAISLSTLRTQVTDRDDLEFDDDWVNAQERFEATKKRKKPNDLVAMVLDGGKLAIGYLSMNSSQASVTSTKGGKDFEKDAFGNKWVVHENKDIYLYKPE